MPKEAPLSKNYNSEIKNMLQKEQQGVNHRSNKLWSILLYPICIIAFTTIALLLFSDNEPEKSFFKRSELFYTRLIWFNFLFSISWFAGCISPIGNLLKYRQQTGGTYLAIASTVLNATILSMLVLFCSIFFPRTRLFDNLPVVIQIIIFLFCVIKIICLKYAQAWQIDGLNVIPTTIKNPEQLIAMLTICEQQPIIIDKFSVAVKRIKEKINHSLPKAGKISSSSNYKDLSLLVEAFYDKLMDGKYDDISADIHLIEKKIVCVKADCKY